MKIPRHSPLKQIRRHCLYCCGGKVKTVRFCHSLDCPLWHLRFGKFPRTVIREGGEKFRQLFDKENFELGAKFCPAEVESAYKL